MHVMRPRTLRLGSTPDPPTHSTSPTPALALHRPPRRRPPMRTGLPCARPPKSVCDSLDPRDPTTLRRPPRPEPGRPRPRALTPPPPPPLSRFPSFSLFRSLLLFFLLPLSLLSFVFSF
ncbi:hypothetical protein RJT34_32776 [Clitoria ternatea]|uniref:Uncharacterized protein n=1 Tax=Clitoria ternatea TaxID=43366 RepID=A0AAN9EYQ7_CLITE